MAKARFDIPSQLPANVARPLYAGVGATDRVAEVVRGAVADVQQRALAVQKTLAGLDYQPQALRQQATQAVTSGVDVLSKDAQARRRALESVVADLPTRLQKLVDEQVATAGGAYDELVKRGEVLVGRIRGQQSTAATTASAKTTTAKAKTTRTQAAKTAQTTKRAATRTASKTAKSPARSSAKATTTAARSTVSNAAKATGDAAGKLGD